MAEKKKAQSMQVVVVKPTFILGHLKYTNRNFVGII